MEVKRLGGMVVEVPYHGDRGRPMAFSAPGHGGVGYPAWFAGLGGRPLRSGMSNPIILCPGQGAQAVGMGKAWFEASAEARAVFEAADTQLGARLGAPLSKLCFEGPADVLNKTDVSQPAIYTASVACWRGLLAKQGMHTNDPAQIGRAHV